MSVWLGPTLLSVASLAPCSAGVWEVGPGDLATIGDAIALASDGDIVLIHAGHYPGFTVAGKSLVIAADAGEDVHVDGNIVVQGLAAAQSVTLQGLTVSVFEGAPAVRATLNDGALWIEDCDVKGWTQPMLEAEACASVVLRRSSFKPYGGGNAVVLRDLTAAVFSCSITGGVGAVGGDPSKCSCTGDPGGPGGTGMLAENSLVLIQLSTLQGGQGGSGDCCFSPTHCGDGGQGGVGLFSMGASEITLVESAVLGGGGGTPGEPICTDGEDGQALEVQGGSVRELPLLARSLETGSPVREGQIASATASGEPFELLALYASFGNTLAALPSLYGFQLLEAPFLPVGAAVLPADGVFQLTAPIPELGASAQGLVLRLQAVSLPTGGGFVLGEAATLVLLDAGI